MQTVGVVAVVDQLVRHILRLLARATEDDAVDGGIVVGYTFQREVLVLRLDHVVDVLDVGCALVAVARHELHGVVHEVLGYLRYLAGHSGGEHQHLAVFGDIAEYLVDVVDEAHVEHLVGLVEYHGMHLVEVHHTAAYQVDEAAGGGHYHLHALAQGLDLALYARAAVYGQHTYAWQVLGKVGEVAGNLQAQLTCGRDDEGLRHFTLAVNALQQRQSESRRLACAGLRQPYHVTVLVEQVRDGHLLYRHGIDKPHLAYGLQQSGVYPQIFKCIQYSPLLVVDARPLTDMLQQPPPMRLTAAYIVT